MNRRWFLSLHAVARCREMGLTRTDVVRVLDDPAVSWPSHGRRVACAGDLAVVFDAQLGVVVTVLWWTQEHYRRAA